MRIFCHQIVIFERARVGKIKIFLKNPINVKLGCPLFASLFAFGTRILKFFAVKKKPMQTNRSFSNKNAPSHLLFLCINFTWDFLIFYIEFFYFPSK